MIQEIESHDLFSYFQEDGHSFHLYGDSKSEYENKNID